METKTYPIEDFRPTKSRGQNFLVDPNLVRKLVAGLEATQAGTVVESGPGTGVLTRGLLEVAGRVVAIEKDRHLAHHLRETLGSNPRFTLVEEDVLQVDLGALGLAPPCRLI